MHGKYHFLEFYYLKNRKMHIFMHKVPYFEFMFAFSPFLFCLENCENCIWRVIFYESWPQIAIAIKLSYKRKHFAHIGRLLDAIHHFKTKVVWARIKMYTLSKFTAFLR